MQLSWQRAALGQLVYVCRPCNKEVAVLPDTWTDGNPGSL